MSLRAAAAATALLAVAGALSVAWGVTAATLASGLALALALPVIAPHLRARLLPLVGLVLAVGGVMALRAWVVPAFFG